MFKLKSRKRFHADRKSGARSALSAFSLFRGVFYDYARGETNTSSFSSVELILALDSIKLLSERSYEIEFNPWNR